MTEVALGLNQVWKKFKRGEKYTSLRDWVPAMTKKLFSGNHQEDLQEKEFWAVKDVSFEVKKGESLGIIGPNGAGKSTILKLLSRILRPNKGGIEVKGRLSALIEVSAGFHPDLTGRENVYLNGSILGMKKREIDKKLDEIVEFSGLIDFLDTPVKRYSSGMYTRLGFSVAAHVEPEILLIDEVLSVGDMSFQQKCVEKMISCRNSGTTIIFVSHNLESVNILCPKTIFLQNGQIEKIGETSRVIKEYVGSARKFEEDAYQEVNINNVTLTNTRNEPQDSFFPGEKARVQLEIKSNKPLDQCLLGFIVNRVTDGIPVCDYNIPIKIDDSNPICDGYIPLSIEFDVNLLRGAYTISLHVTHPSGGKYLFSERIIGSFIVEERISWCGIAHLNPVLKEVKKSN
jgi:lipopolysaccharide transport system ATP-binding protein